MNPSTKSTPTGVKAKKSKSSKVQAHSSHESTHQNEGNSTEKDKGSPSKDFIGYAGISADSIRSYAGQTHYEDLTGEMCNILTEDINYKLRYIIHSALVKAKIQGREIVSSDDIDETFSNLNINKIYGLPSNPVWLNYTDNNIFCLEDQKINLVEIAEEENSYTQEGSILIDHVWLPDGNESEDQGNYAETFGDYFQAICQAVISNSEELRMIALKDVSENPSIGPITNWFYNYSYFLLMKDRNNLTVKALQLLEVLENSPLPSLNVSGKHLKLLVRLLLQRLLHSVVTKDVLKPICYLLSLLCLRPPIKHIVLSRVKEIILNDTIKLPVLTLIYYLGLDAVQQVFIPNIMYFLTIDNEAISEVLMGIYGIICKAGLNDALTYSYFEKMQIFGTELVPYWIPNKIKQAPAKLNVDFIRMKKELIKTRRKIDVQKTKQEKKSLNELFEIPTHDCLIKRALDNHQVVISGDIPTHITVGKFSFLLPVLKSEKKQSCLDHSLYNYL